ncbi:hypothetical protein JCM8547_000293 [Rhodosporidiobolus lusitaniae]
MLLSLPNKLIKAVVRFSLPRHTGRTTYTIQAASATGRQVFDEVVMKLQEHRFSRFRYMSFIGDKEISLSYLALNMHNAAYFLREIRLSELRNVHLSLLQDFPAFVRPADFEKLAAATETISSRAVDDIRTKVLYIPPSFLTPAWHANRVKDFCTPSKSEESKSAS